MMLTAIAAPDSLLIAAVLLAVVWILVGPLLFGFLLRDLRRLEQRVAELERSPRATAAVSGERLQPRPNHPRPPAESLPSAPPPPAPAAVEPAFSDSMDLENLLAGRWLNRIGIVALLFGVAFFLRYAFQNGWVGPEGRVLVGLFAGVLLLGWSERLVRSGYRYFGDGIAGLGAAVLYLSLYAAWGFYRLIPQPLAFSGMVLVTAALASVAWRRSSHGLILIAQAGGLLTPALLSSGQDQHLSLFLYLAVLNAAFLLLAERKNWQIPLWLGFGASAIYLWLWYDSFYRPALLGITVFFFLFFFVLFQLPAGLRAWGKIPSGSRAELAVANAMLLLVELAFPLWPDHRGLLAAVVLAAAAASAAVLWAGRGRGLARDRIALAAVALLLLTVAVPFRYDGKWITLLWSVEALLLTERGFAHRLRGLRMAGLLVFGAVAVRLLLFTVRLPSHQVLWNERFGIFAAALACMMAALLLHQRWAAECSRDEGTVFSILRVGLHAFALVALSLEVWDGLRRAGARGAVDRELAPQLGLSLLWAMYASGLMVFGVRRSARLLRWLALVLFGLVIGKVFFFDLSFLSSGYRILSFLALGLLLLAVSFLYQRRTSGSDRGERPSA